MIRQTSLMAYEELGKKRQTQIEHILFFLSRAPMGLTRNEIRRLTGYPINVITARVHRLLRTKKVYESGLKINRYSNKYNNIVRLSSQRECGGVYMGGVT